MTDIVLPTLKMEGYVIVDLNTGLFSSGGTNPRFKKKGKIWSSLGHLKNHLALFTEKYYRDNADPYRKAKAKAFDIVTGKELFDVSEYIDRRGKEMMIEREQRMERYRKQRKLDLERELKELNKES